MNENSLAVTEVSELIAARMRQPEFRIDAGFFILTIWRKTFKTLVVQPMLKIESRLESPLAAKILTILKTVNRASLDWHSNWGIKQCQGNFINKSGDL